MCKHSDLIVMLSDSDINVPNLPERFRECRDLPLRHWGFKNVHLSDEVIAGHIRMMKEAGKTVYLEVISYYTAEYRRIARIAEREPPDYVLGTIFDPELLSQLHRAGVGYIPFSGKTPEYPGIIIREEEDILEEARDLCGKGVDGIAVPAYRHICLDGGVLARNLRENIPAEIPLLVVGSVNSYERIDAMMDAGISAFTIGSALFHNQFVHGGGFRRNLEEVSGYIYGEA